LKTHPVKPDTSRPWKTSLVFTTRNVPGALFRSLSAFALRDLNLAKIESRPLRGRPWEYLFYLDLEAHTDDPVTQNALHHLGELADFLRVLGTYPRGTSDPATRGHGDTGTGARGQRRASSARLSRPV
jgi:prephenate dehydratase